jgi:hypothetical protein
MQPIHTAGRKENPVALEFHHLHTWEVDSHTVRLLGWSEKNLIAGEFPISLPLAIGSQTAVTFGRVSSLRVEGQTNVIAQADASVLTPRQLLRIGWTLRNCLLWRLGDWLPTARVESNGASAKGSQNKGDLDDSLVFTGLSDSPREEKSRAPQTF